MSAAAAKNTHPQTVVAFFDPKKPHGVVSGDSIAKYYQGKRHFDAEGFVVHPNHVTRSQAEVVDAHEKHREDQREARAEAEAQVKRASDTLAGMLDTDDVHAEEPVEQPESGWDETSVTKKFAHRMPDVLKLKALNNKAINAALKNAKMEFNPNNGAAAKWQNIHALLEATEPDAKGDQTGTGADGKQG